MIYRGRFAPSPTGCLHFGSLVAAIASFAQARQRQGTWLVRMEDLDPPREVAGASEGIIRDLGTFGMISDEPVIFQSRRKLVYQGVLDQLLRDQMAFHCGCSRSELPSPGVYPGTCRDGLPIGKDARSVRIRVPTEELSFEDRVQGQFVQSLNQDVGDFVIRRADGLTAYQLAVVIDDSEQNISEIVRGCDLLDSSPRQIFLQQRLELPTPRYAHIPIAVDADGQKLSKQSDSRPVNAQAPMSALVSAWQFLGQSDPPPNARASVSGFWSWAIGAWRIAKVPRLRAIAVG